jgi:hypothetical protein
MLVGGEGEVQWHGGVVPHLLQVLAWPEAVRGSLATHTGGPEMVVPAAAAVSGALVAVAVGGGAEEMRRKLGDVRVRLAWAEVDGEGERTAVLACCHGGRPRQSREGKRETAPAARAI